MLLSVAARADCTNCTTTAVGGDVVHTWTNTGVCTGGSACTFTPPAGVTSVQYLVVGGGGGGGGIQAGNSGGAGGGGAGGYRASAAFAVTPLTAYNVTVGGSGAAGVGGSAPGGSGGNSAFATITSVGGGGGASQGDNNGVAGGSGGGGRLTTAGTGGAGTVGQGNSGGDGASAGFGAGGGGGAAAAGVTPNSGTGGNGGGGSASTISGASVTYAGGGGGGGYNAAGGNGGAGGGGSAPGARGDGNSGTANTGGGGGGASGSTAGNAQTGGTGGSGIVIVRYTVPVPPGKYAVATGNWNASIWSTGGCLGGTGAATPINGENVYICNTRTVTVNVVTANLGTLTVMAGGTLNGNNSITVAGATTVDGTLNATTNTGTKSFNGTTTVNAGGVMTLGASVVNFAGTVGVSGTLNVTSNTGAKTFNSGVTVNSGGLASLAAGSPTFNSTVAVAGTMECTSNTGTKTYAGTVTVQNGGILDLQSCTADFNNTTTIQSGGTLQFTTGNAGTKTFNGAVAINAGGTWNNTSPNNEGVTFGGDLINNGTFTSPSTGAYVFAGNGQWGGNQPMSFGGAVNVNANISMTNNNTATAGLSVAGNLALANNATATNNGTVSVVGNLTGGNASSTWTNAASSTLNVAGTVMTTGTLNASANGNTVNYNGSGNQTLKTPSSNNYFHLTLSGGGTKTPPGGTLNVLGNLLVDAGPIFNVNTNDPTLNVTGTMTINATGTYTGSNTAALTVGGNVIIGGTFTGTNGAANFAGNFTNNGTFTSGNGQYTFNGSAAQSITGSSASSAFVNMTLNNANGLTLTGTHDITVSTLLTLTSGRITTNANTVFVSNGSNIAGAGANTFIVGNLRKQFATGANTRVFEVGTITSGVRYTPVTVVLGSVSGAGALTATSVFGDHPNIGSSTLDANLSINRYWTLSNNTVTFAANAGNSLAFTFINPDDYDVGANFNNFVAGRYNAPNWTEITPTGRTATTTTITGIGIDSTNIVADYQVAEKFVAPPFACPGGTQLASGIEGDYFNNMTLTNPVTGTRVDGPIDFNWGNGAPGVAGIGADQFSVRWDGAVRVNATGNYQFQTVSDDGVRLYVNGVLVINNWTDHSPTTNTSGTVALTGGQLYPLTLEFYENTGGAEIRLRMGPAGGPYTAIPAGPAPPSLGEGLYYCQTIPIPTDIVVTTGGSTDNIIGGSIFLTGTTDGDPEASNTNTNTNTNTITTTITTQSANAWLVDVVGSGNAGSYTQPGAQTERWDVQAASSTGAASTKPTTTQGGNSMSQTHSNGNRQAHAVISIAPAGTIAFDSAFSAFVNSSNTLTWGHPVIPGTEGKLIVGISIEDPSCGGNETVSSVTHNGIPLTFVTSVSTPAAGFCEHVEIWYRDFGAKTVIAEYRMDEATWNGTANEVVDTSGNNRHGTATNGAVTASTSPAVPNSPGTCHYGVFDGTNDYVNVANLSNILNETASLAFWIRTTQTGNNLGWQAPGVTGVEQSGGANDIFWGWIDATGHIGISVGDAYDNNKSFTAINDGTWHHVVLSRDHNAGVYRIYIDGVLDRSGAIATGTITTPFSSIGRIEDTGGTPVYFNGNLDEVRVYDQVLSLANVLDIMNDTRPCIAVTVDHFDVNVLSGTSASTCFASEIQIVARDASSNQLSGYSGTINLSTSRGNGDWSKLDEVGGPSSDPANGALNPGGADSGAATYSFVAGTSPGQDDGTISIFLLNTHAEDMTVTVVDDSLPATASTSAIINFRDNAFVVVDQGSAGLAFPGNPVAGRPHAFRIDMVRRDPGTGDCGLATNYAATDIKAWYAPHVDHPGGAAAPSLQTASETQLLPAAEPGSANLTIPFAAGTANFSLITTDVGKYTLNLKDDSSGFATVDISGNFGAFTVRPFGIAITNIRADGGATPNPGALTPGGGLFTSAGSDFLVTVGAYRWSSADDDGAPFGTAGDGLPDSTTSGNLLLGVDITDNGLTSAFAWNGALSAVLYAPTIGQGGTLGALANNNLTAAGFSGGQATISSLRYMEAGAIRLAATFSNFLNTGSMDITGGSHFNGTAANAGTVGRFGAEEFDFVVNTAPTLGAACGAYTYIDQSFTFSNTPQITARALAANSGTVLQNYHNFSGAGGGNWWLLNLGAGISQIYDDPAAPAGITFADAAGYSPTSGSGTNGQVQFTLNGPFTYDDRSAPPYGPVDAFDAQVELAFTVTDTDGATGTLSIDPITFASPEQRWGRMVIGTVAGSELLSLAVPMRTEYFDGGSFIPNVNDACTSVAATELILTSAVEGPVTGDTVQIRTGAPTVATIANDPFAQGQAGLSFSPPGAGMTGYADITLDLNASGEDWLRADWDGDGVPDNDPAGRVTFGVFGGNENLIYIREPWN